VIDSEHNENTHGGANDRSPSIVRQERQGFYTTHIGPRCDEPAV